LRVGGSPQRALGLSYRYNARKYWSASIAINYLDQHYTEPNPDRRTAEALQKFNRSEIVEAMEVAGQEELPSVYYINLVLNKSYRYRHKYNFNISLAINNLFNKRNLIIAGHESLRWDAANITKFPNKYNYMQGLNGLLNLSMNY
jgi:outer membrane receptor for Fe3+-dicitrate